MHQAVCRTHAQLDEEMALLIAMYPDEVVLEGRFLYFRLPPLDLELSFPPGFPQRGKPTLISVRGLTQEAVGAVISEYYTDSDSTEDGDNRGRLHELIQRVRELAEDDILQPPSPPSIHQSSSLDEDNPATRRVAAAEVYRLLPVSLEAAGFLRFGSSFVHAKLRCTIELHNPTECGATSDCVVATADGMDDEDLVQFIALELATNPTCVGFGTQLVKAVRDMRFMASEDADTDVSHSQGAPAPSTHGEVEERCRDKLPTPDALSAIIWPDGSRQINGERQLQLLTWGDSLLGKRSEKLRGVQFHVNAKLLNGRGGGADTKHNALQDSRILLNVADSLSSGRGLLLLSQTVRKIEEENLDCISVFCSKGRHRSVSLAVLLKVACYPQAGVRHLTIT